MNYKLINISRKKKIERRSVEILPDEINLFSVGFRVKRYVFLFKMYSRDLEESSP